MQQMSHVLLSVCGRRHRRTPGGRSALLQFRLGARTAQVLCKQTHVHERCFGSSIGATYHPGVAPESSTPVPSELMGNFQGLEVTFLGTGAAAPSPRRNVLSVAVRIGLAEQRKSAALWLFDVGEATQHQLMRSHLHMGRIERIFLTHLHGDHCFGLAGLLCGLGANSVPDDQSETAGDSGDAPGDRRGRLPLVDVYGPPGLRLLVRSALGVGRAHPRLRLRLHEIVPPAPDVLRDWYEWSRQFMNVEDNRLSRAALRTWAETLAPTMDCSLPMLPCEQAGTDFHFPSLADVQSMPEDPRIHGSIALKLVDDERGSVYVAPLRHSVPCFGYVIVEKQRLPRIDLVALRQKYQLETHPILKELKLGRSVPHPHDASKWIEPSEVLQPAAGPRKLVILGDTYDSTLILPAAHQCQLLVHEATLGDELAHRARSVQHSTARMAGAFAKRANLTGALALTHISARYDDQDGRSSRQLLAEARQGAKDGQFSIFIAEDLQRVQVPGTTAQCDPALMRYSTRSADSDSAVMLDAL